MTFCKDNTTCIHNSLICDGYVQCPDGSDEGHEASCDRCPPKHKFNKKLSTHTFSCSHIYTGNPICVIPCNGVDEGCVNGEDELCDAYSIEAFVIVFLIILFATFIVSEALFQKGLLHCESNSNCLQAPDVEQLVVAFTNWVHLSSNGERSNEEQEQELKKAYKSFHSAAKDFKKLFLELKVNLSPNLYSEVVIFTGKLENEIHGEDKFDVRWCLLQNLGNGDQTAEYLELTEPGWFMWIKNFFDEITTQAKEKLQESAKLSRSCNRSETQEEVETDQENAQCMGKFKICIVMVKGIVATIFKIGVYYADLVKDVYLTFALMTLPTAIIGWTITGILTMSLVSSFMANAALMLINVNNLLSTNVNIIVKAFVVIIFSPFLPAFAIYQIGRHEMFVDLMFLTKSWKKGNEPGKSLSGISSRIESSQKQIRVWKELLAQFRRNENSLEHLPQV